MGFNFLNYFYTDEFDNKPVIKKNGKTFSLLEIKNLVSDVVSYLDSIDEKDILIDTDDNFDFIILFLGLLFAEKNIIVSNNNKKERGKFFSISKLKFGGKKTVFKRIDTDNIKLSISTSGTTKEASLITKNITQVLKESRDFIDEVNIPINKDFEFIISTPINHMYAITAYIFAGLDSKNIINTDRINYLEDLKIKNSIFVSSPSFLSYIQKFNLTPEIAPYMIFSAGSKLSKTCFKYFEKFSKVINLYGCTETGFIGYQKSSNEEFFTLLKGIKILNEEKTSIISDYAMPDKIVLDDKIIIENRKIKVLGRMGRIFKIQEKRISADEIEEEILKNKFITDCAIINVEDKIAAFCALNEIGQSFLIKEGTLSLIKNIKQELTEKFGIVPQKWKFTDIIPKNDMGKVDYKKITDLFSINLSLPLVLKREIKEDSAEFELCFYRNCNFFKGHFDNFPITAGVIQLFYASYFIKEVFKKDCSMGQIKRVKFSNIIHPDKIVKLKLEKTEKSICFEYYDEEKSYSTGAMPVQNIFQKEIL